jgi:hypothetical protein
MKSTDNNIKCIAIDYAQYIEDATNISKARDIARKTKEITKKYKIYGLLAIQTGKSCPDAYTPISDEHIEGVAAIKQSCDYLIGIHKDKKDKSLLHARFLKSRWSMGDEKFILKRNGLKYFTQEEKEEEDENL